MALSEESELSQLTELSEQLTRDNVERIILILDLPTALFKDTNAVEFLFSMKAWSEHNPFRFYLALLETAPELVSIAIRMVMSPLACEYPPPIKQSSIKTLIYLLKAELTVDKLKVIHITFSKEVEGNIDIEKILKMLFEKGKIEKDLISLIELMEAIKRNDICNKLREYQRAFQGMEEGEFHIKFKKELASLGKI